MICQTCKDAGLQNQRGMWFREKDRKRESAQSFKRATELHGDCRGCDCQHTVGIRTLNSDYSIDLDGRPL